MSAALVGSKRFTGVTGKSSVKLVNDWFSLPESSLLLEQRGRLSRGRVQPPGPDAGWGSAPGELGASRCLHIWLPERVAGFTACWRGPAHNRLLSGPGCILSEKPFILE